MGRYNWTVDEALLGSKLYHTSSELRPVPRLIALHPSIDLSKTRDWHDLKLVLQVSGGRWRRGGAPALLAAAASRCTELPD